MTAAATTLTLLRPEQFARIRSLHIWARMIVEGTNVGVHRSPYHGFSAEFLEYRAYQPGESARMIDWRKYDEKRQALMKKHLLALQATPGLTPETFEIVEKGLK